MDSTTVQTVLAGAILAAILWLARSVNEYGKALTELRVILTGADGTNGLNGEVKNLRRRAHDLGDAVNALGGKHELLAQRVTTIEEQVG